MGARPGTVVVVPTLTFAAVAGAVVYTGAEPVFVGCEPETGRAVSSAGSGGRLS